MPDFRDRHFIPAGEWAHRNPLPAARQLSARMLRSTCERGPLTQLPKQESWGRWAMVADPDGNEIMLVPGS
jgi:hypothetical protein